MKTSLFDPGSFPRFFNLNSTKMNPESPPPCNEMMNYFVTQLPDNWNVLKFDIHFALDGKILGVPKNHFQFVVTRMLPSGTAEGFSLNLN